MWFKARVLSLLVGLSGCAVGPDYQAPEPILPQRWEASRQAMKPLKPASESRLGVWWKSFEDPTLDRLMARAKSDNLDLKMAYTRIGQSRAERLAHRAALFPKIGANASAAYLENMIPGMNQGGNSLEFFLSGFDAIWEIDVFGRLRRKLEAASAMTESSKEAYRQAWVMLSAELARNYIDYRNLQNQLRITRANLDSQQRTLDLTEQLFEEGVGNRYDVTRARAQLEATEAAIPEIEGGLIDRQHRLEILVGGKPGVLRAQLDSPGPVPISTSLELLTTPAETLRFRPAVRRAERELEAATANQGAAIGELFPKISVAAFMGVQNSDLENLFRSTAFSWASGSAIMQPIFNFGRIRAGINLADARQEEAYLNYEKSVVEALNETETAMTRLLKEEQRRRKLASSVADLKEAFRLARLRYGEGVSSFLDVLDAERILYRDELELARSRARTSLYLIALYKALGGSGQLEVKPLADPILPWG